MAVANTIWVTLLTSKPKTRNAIERICVQQFEHRKQTSPYRCPLAMTFWVESGFPDWLKAKVWCDLPQLWLVNLTCSTGSAANVSACLQKRKSTSHPPSRQWTSLGISASLTFVFPELGVTIMFLIESHWWAAEPTCNVIIKCGPQVHDKSPKTITIVNHFKGKQSLVQHDSIYRNSFI